MFQNLMLSNPMLSNLMLSSRSNARHVLAGLLGLALAATAAVADARVRSVTDPDAPRSLPAEGPVSVRWTDPSQFTELRTSGNRFEARRGDWVTDLAEHLREAAQKRLAPGQRMDVEITDIRRAGMYEPWRGISMQDVRIMRDIYPPRVTLSFRVTDADGRVVDEGERKLVDSSYLMRSSIFNDSDSLRYEKAMIDRWLRDELPATPAA